MGLLCTSVTNDGGAGGYDLFHHNDKGDDHYGCWYHCDRRHQKYDSTRHRKYCWYHDRYGWYYSRCHGRDGWK